MSDVSQGPGWWQASDGKWYPPELHPNAQAATPPTAPPGTPPTTPPSAAPGQPAWQQPGYGQFGAGQPPMAGQVPPYGAATGMPGPVTGPMGMPLATWGDRVLAALIDWAMVFVVAIVGLIIAAILGAVSDALGTLVGLIVYVAAIAGSFYFGYLTGLKGQSPGKAIMGIKIVNMETGAYIGGGMGIVRQLAHILDGFCYIGYLWPLWDQKNQTFADKILSTVSVKGVPKQSFSLDLFKP